MRAVDRDMIALHERVVNVEGRHAAVDELELYHDGEYLERARSWVGEAERAGQPVRVEGELVVSAATWDASTAAVGCVLTAIDLVLDGRADRAFCVVRPPGRDSGSSAHGRLGIVNPLAVGARYLTKRLGGARAAIVEWGAGRSLQEMMSPDTDLQVASLGSIYPSEVRGGGGARAGAADALGLADAARRRLEDLGAMGVDVVFLSADFEFPGPATTVLEERPRSTGYHAATMAVVEHAQRVSGGRLISVLEGGWDAVALGEAAVQHLRALAGLPPAPER